MSFKRPASQLSQDLALAMRARPLGRADLVLMRAAMAEAAPDWSVELQGICSDEATLVLLPEDGEDAMGPSLLVSRDSQGFRVDQVHWDVVTEIGIYASLLDVVDVLRLHLAFCSRFGVPALMTVH